MKCFIFITAVLLSTVSYGQNDSLQTSPKRWLHLHIANGINFIRNETLQSSYATKAIYFWGVGVRIGNPQKSEIYINVDYNFSNYQLINEVNQVEQDSILRLNQLIPSLSLQLLHWRNVSVRTKAGYIFSYLKDDINDLNEVSPGFKLGLGIENKLFQSQAVHFDLDYDLMKAKGKGYKDYDVWKVSIGIYL